MIYWNEIFFTEGKAKAKVLFVIYDLFEFQRRQKKKKENIQKHTRKLGSYAHNF